MSWLKTIGQPLSSRASHLERSLSMRRAVIYAACALLIAGCGDDVTVNPAAPAPTQPNVPPRIVAHGPTLPSGVIDADEGTPSLFVIVADDNGLADVSAVLLSIDRAVFHRVIFRRDSVSPPCVPFVIYSPNDTVDISAVMPVDLAYSAPFQPGCWPPRRWSSPWSCRSPRSCSKVRDGRRGH